MVYNAGLSRRVVRVRIPLVLQYMRCWFESNLAALRSVVEWRARIFFRYLEYGVISVTH